MQNNKYPHKMENIFQLLRFPNSQTIRTLLHSSEHELQSGNMVGRFYYLSKYGMQHMAGCCGGNMLLTTAHWSAQKVQNKITFSVSAMEVNKLTK